MVRFLEVKLNVSTSLNSVWFCCYDLCRKGGTSTIPMSVNETLSLSTIKTIKGVGKEKVEMIISRVKKKAFFLGISIVNKPRI